MVAERDMATTKLIASGGIVRPRRSRAPFLLILPAALVLLVFLVIPYINIVAMSFRPPGDGTPYGPGSRSRTIASSSRTASTCFRSSTRCGSAPSSPHAASSSAFPSPGTSRGAQSRLRPLYYSIVLAPLLVGIVIRSYGWTVLLGNNGVINRTLHELGHYRWSAAADVQRARHRASRSPTCCCPS